MRWRTTYVVAIAGVALLLVFLFAPFSNSERTIIAPDPSSYAGAVSLALGQLSYLPVSQVGHSSLAYLWFGVGPSPSYDSSNRCDTTQFVCSYEATSTFPEVFLALNSTQPIPIVDISQLHLRLNQSEFVSIVVTFMLRNDGAAVVEPSVTLNGTVSSLFQYAVTNPEQSTSYSIAVYPAVIPKLGDHYFVKIVIASTPGEAFWFGYAQVEG
jgi:predicted Abi (CAAX) family protease